MPPRCSQHSSHRFQHFRRSNQHADRTAEQAPSKPRLTLRLGCNPVLSEDIDGETQPNDTQKTSIDENEISSGQASIELGTQNYTQLANQTRMMTEKPIIKSIIKPISQIKLFIFIDALAEKNQIAGDSDVRDFDRFFDVHSLHEKYTE